MKPVSIKIECVECKHSTSMIYIKDYEIDNENSKDSFSLNNTSDLVYPKMTPTGYDIFKENMPDTNQRVAGIIAIIEKHRVGGLLSKHCRLSEKYFKVFNHYFVDHENKTGGFTYRLIEEMVPAQTFDVDGKIAITFVSKHDEMSKKVDELMNAGYYKDVIQIMNTELATNPNDNHALFHKGEALLALEYYKEAIDCYDKVLETEPTNSICLISKGVALRHLERYDEAIACYDKVLEVEPNGTETMATVLSSKGVALRHLERYDEAIACYDKALEIESADFKIWSNKGSSLFALERYDEAIACYDKALEIEPDHPQIIEGRNNALDELKK